MILAVASCERRGQRDGVADEERIVMNVVAISGSSIAAPLRVSRHGFTATATWELSLSTTWPQYHEAIRLTSIGYRELSADAGSATLARSTSGDAFTLRIEKVTVGAPLHVRFTLTAMPN